MSRKQSNVSLAVATKALSDEVAEDAFVRGRSSSSGDTKASRRHNAKRRMTVYLPEDLALALERLAVEERDSVSSLIERAVRTQVKTPKR